MLVRSVLLDVLFIIPVPAPTSLVYKMTPRKHYQWMYDIVKVLASLCSNRCQTGIISQERNTHTAKDASPSTKIARNWVKRLKTAAADEYCSKPVWDVDEKATDGHKQKRFICATCVDSCIGENCDGGPIVVDRPVPVPKPIPVPIPVPRPQPKPFPVPVPVPVPPPPPKVVPVPMPVPVQSGCTTGVCVSTCVGGAPC
uniref:ShKT domain-containing protein n=1 Tax=Ascaris lumbricoides TaxID=6252 RepID=A0A9J2PD84_ASCLU